MQSRLRYQEALAELHKIQEEWGPALGLEVSTETSPRTISSTQTCSEEDAVDGGPGTTRSVCVGPTRRRNEVGMVKLIE